MARIVVGTDGSDSAAPAVRFAAGQAAGGGALLEIVHVYDEPSTVSPGRIGAPQYHNTKPVEGDAERIVNQAAELAKSVAPDVEIEPSRWRATRSRCCATPAPTPTCWWSGRGRGAICRRSCAAPSLRRPPQGHVPRGRRARRAHRRRPRGRRDRWQRRGDGRGALGGRRGRAQQDVPAHHPRLDGGEPRGARSDGRRRTVRGRLERPERRRGRGRGEGARGGRRGRRRGIEITAASQRARRSRRRRRRRRARRWSWSARTAGATPPSWWGPPATGSCARVVPGGLRAHLTELGRRFRLRAVRSRH